VQSIQVNYVALVLLNYHPFLLQDTCIAFPRVDLLAIFLSKLSRTSRNFFILINPYLYMGSVFSMAGHNKYLARPGPTLGYATGFRGAYKY